MHISTVNKYNTYTITKRRFEREGFGEGFVNATALQELKKKISIALENKGRIYGIYKKKELVGIYIFEKIDNYFVKTEGAGVTIGEKKIDFESVWFGESTAAFRLTEKILTDEIKKYEEKIEKDIKVDLGEQIISGQIAGIEWNNELMYRRQIDKKGRGSKYLLGYLGGFFLGLFMGWIIFDTLAMGLCFGACYASLWGSVGIAISSSKTVWASYDFINHEYHQENEKHIDNEKTEKNGE